MFSAIQYILYFGVVLSSVLSVYYSFKYRRETDAKKRGLFTARMNICMGVMLVCIAVVQLYLFADSSIRVVVGSAFLLIGLFNLFAGIRNHSVYTRLKIK